MNSTEKQKCRERIAREGWNKIGIIEDCPDVRYWYGGKELELMYEDMDGRVCTCRAMYHHPSESYMATTGPAKGNRMSYTIAWRPVPEVKTEASAGAGNDEDSIPFS